MSDWSGLRSSGGGSQIPDLRRCHQSQLGCGRLEKMILCDKSVILNTVSGHNTLYMIPVYIHVVLKINKKLTPSAGKGPVFYSKVPPFQGH